MGKKKNKKNDGEGLQVRKQCIAIAIAMCCASSFVTLSFTTDLFDCFKFGSSECEVKTVESETTESRCKDDTRESCKCSRCGCKCGTAWTCCVNPRCKTCRDNCDCVHDERRKGGVRKIRYREGEKNEQER